MSERDPLVELRRADTALREVTVPADVDARVRAALAPPAAESRTGALRLVVAAAAVVLAVGVGVVGSEVDWLRDRGATGSAAERQPGDVRLVLDDGARVEERDGAYHLLAGRALFDVTPRAPGQPPVIVRIGDARIEVVGTRFAVTRGPREGHVHLFRGAVRLVEADGQRWTLLPDEQRTFALRRRDTRATESVEDAPSPPAEPAHDGAAPAPSEPAASSPPALQRTPPTREPPSAAPAAARPRGPAPSPEDVEESIARVAALRSAGDDEAALAELDRLLALDLDRRAAETLSFERGLALERLDDERACAHWQAHGRRYPGGRYDDAVARAVKRRCDEG